MKYKNCLLKVKKINLENTDKVKDISLEWKFNPKTGQLDIRVIKTPSTTYGCGYTNINVVYRDYNDWM